MMTYLKRRIGDMLTSRLLHKLVVKPAINNGFLLTDTGSICVRDQSPYLQSLIYWKLYERSEVKLIKRFLKQNVPVIEFGASLGMTSASICTTLNKTVRVISVEANPKLFYNLTETKNRNGFDNLQLICAAVDYSGEPSISFMLDESNLGSHKGISENSVQVPAVELNRIVRENQLKHFALVCDIEGAELELFINETNTQVIEACTQIIIELHPAEYNGKKYVRSEINDIILEKFKMRTIYTDGKTWVYEKKK